MENIHKHIIIFRSRTVAMQRLMDAVSNGYSNYCFGSIDVNRCEKLVKKFGLNYHVLSDRNERARRKRAGLGNATIVLWLNNGVVHWWLMVTPPNFGDHAAHSIENLHDANSVCGRIEVEGFELVRLPKKSTHKLTATSNQQPAPRKPTSTSKLTWRMSKHKYQSWRDSIIEGVRGSNFKSLEMLLYQLWSSPGFSGIRSQIGHLTALYKSEVKRAGRKDAPALPKRLGYVRRLGNAGIPLSELVAQHKAQSTLQHVSLGNTAVDVKGSPESEASGMANSVTGNQVL